MGDIRPSLTAHIDLLGFSEHLVLARYDPRSKVGAEALRRLEFIEEALKLIEAEHKESPELFPEGARYMRLNDSLLLQMDLDESYIRAIGTVDIRGPTILDAEKWGATHGIPEGDFMAINKQLFEHQGKEVAKFLGLVARTHNFLNLQENSAYFPGCRTVVASGLRKPFIDRNKDDDFLAINFSLANSYFIQERGSELGLKGQSLYADDNVGWVIAHHPTAGKLLYFCQFIERINKGNPYSRYPQYFLHGMETLSESSRVDIDIYRQRYIFSELNPAVASNLQLVEHIDGAICSETSEECFLRGYADILRSELPTRESVLSADHHRTQFPFYYLKLDLRDSIASTLKLLLKGFKEARASS